MTHVRMRMRMRMHTLRQEIMWRGACALLELGAIITLLGIVSKLCE